METPVVDLVECQGVGGAAQQLKAAELLTDQGWLGKGVVLLMGEQLLDQHGELSGQGHGGDVGPASALDALGEGTQRPGGADACQAASTSTWRPSPEPCLLILPWRAGPLPD